MRKLRVSSVWKSLSRVSFGTKKFGPTLDQFQEIPPRPKIEKKKKLESAFFNFSRKATRDADRMEIQKCNQRTDGLTWEGARDTCMPKKGMLWYSSGFVLGKMNLGASETFSRNYPFLLQKLAVYQSHSEQRLWVQCAWSRRPSHQQGRWVQGWGREWPNSYNPILTSLLAAVKCE